METRKNIDVTTNAPNDLNQYVGIVEYDRSYERSPGTYVDITLLKRAILWIQSERPDAKSFRITSINTNSLPFLLIETKDQDIEGDRKSAFVIAPLTTHVDRAEKFADISLDVYMQPETTRRFTTENTGEGGKTLFADIAREFDTYSRDVDECTYTPERKAGSAFSGIEVVGSAPATKQKRKYTKK